MKNQRSILWILMNISMLCILRLFRCSPFDVVVNIEVYIVIFCLSAYLFSFQYVAQFLAGEWMSELFSPFYLAEHTHHFSDLMKRLELRNKYLHIFTKTILGMLHTVYQRIYRFFFNFCNPLQAISMFARMNVYFVCVCALYMHCKCYTTVSCRFFLLFICQPLWGWRMSARVFVCCEYI